MPADTYTYIFPQENTNTDGTAAIPGAAGIVNPHSNIVSGSSATIPTTQGILDGGVIKRS